MGLSQVFDLVLQTLESLHRLVVLILQKLEVVTEADLEWIVLGTNGEKCLKQYDNESNVKVAMVKEQL